MSTIANLKKAYQSKAITKDTHSLQEFLVKFQDSKTKIARMEVVELETRYIEQYDSNSPRAKQGVSGNGYRTRFILKDGTTIGTFSQAGYQFFKFFSELMQYDHVGNFLHINIDGVLQVDVTKEDLDGNKTTYNFDIVEEGSILNGLTEYLPTTNTVLAIENNEQ
jgi:hypothetical protein